MSAEACPDVIGPWLPERLIGTGAVASVYLCRDGGGREAAVKWLNHSHGPLVNRFLREVDSLKRLDHPGITSFIDSGDEGGRPYLAMEHISGLDLRLFTSKLHKRPSSERYARCRSIGRTLCDALEHIHRAGMVHRDVKPSNVFMADDGRVVLGDFGVVKDPDALDKTAVGVVVGTLAYAAPEQIEGELVDPRTDLFGLGATLYFVLTQERPFKGLNRDLQALPIPPSRVDPGIPPDLEGVVMRLLAANPSNRPRDAHSVRGLLSVGDPGGTVLAGTRGTVQRVAECLERASEGEALYVRPMGPAGTRKAWVGDLLRQGAQRRGIPAIEVLEWGAWAAVRERLDAGEALLVISPHELDVPTHVGREEIMLSPLNLADVRRSLVSIAPKVENAPSVAATLHEWTGGLPRLLAAILEENSKDGSFVLPEFSSTNDHLTRFVGGLDLDDLEVAGAIALAPEPLDTGTIEEITNVPADDVVQRLIEKGLVVETAGRFRLMGLLFGPAIEKCLVDPEGLQERVYQVLGLSGGPDGEEGMPSWVVEEVHKGIAKAEHALLQGELGSGLRAVQRAVDLSSSLSDRSLKGEATIALANVLIRLGMLEEAGRHLADATALAHAIGRQDQRRLCHALRAWVTLDQNPRSRAAAASAVDRVLPMLSGADGRGSRPEDAMLYGIWARASAVLGDVASYRRAYVITMKRAVAVSEPLALGLRLQLARGAMVLRETDEARTLARAVVARKEIYPLLAWEGSRLLALVDGSVPPPPGSFIDGLSEASIEALESRPI
jgi:serine/threonine-protein kinase